jgi:hypothetical protein
VAVFLVAIVTAGNNYTKELQFRALEKSSQRDERCSVLRDGSIERINPIDLVVGDIIILQVHPGLELASLILLPLSVCLFVSICLCPSSLCLSQPRCISSLVTRSQRILFSSMKVW